MTLKEVTCIKTHCYNFRLTLFGDTIYLWMLPYSIMVDGVTLDFTSFAKLKKFSVLESLENFLFWKAWKIFCFGLYEDHYSHEDLSFCHGIAIFLANR